MVGGSGGMVSMAWVGDGFLKREQRLPRRSVVRLGDRNEIAWRLERSSPSGIIISFGSIAACMQKVSSSFVKMAPNGDVRGASDFSWAGEWKWCYGKVEEKRGESMVRRHFDET